MIADYPVLKHPRAWHDDDSLRFRLAPDLVRSTLDRRPPQIFHAQGQKSTIAVQGTSISVLSQPAGDFISLTDMVRNFDGAGALIEQWLKNKDTVLFLGVWERINNPGFNSIEFEGIRNEAGRNSFFLSAKKWIALTHATGLIASAGRYGGTYAHRTSPSSLAHGSARSSNSTSSRNFSASRTRKTTGSSSAGISSAPSPRSITASTPMPSARRCCRPPSPSRRPRSYTPLRPTCSTLPSSASLP